MRREFSKGTKLSAFMRAGGLCEKCGVKLFKKSTEYHHVKEATFDGEPTLENCLAICTACHREITRGRAPAIAKSNRIRKRHVGIKKARTILAWRKFNGELVRHTRTRGN